MKKYKQKRPKFKALPLHKEAKKPRDIVQFYNDPSRANRLSHGYHLFQIGCVGHKWVKLRPAYLNPFAQNQWTKIKRSRWNEILECKSYRVMESASA